jgi:hypothetical protein
MKNERLRELLEYDPETGVFLWKTRTSNRVKIGSVAGTKHGKGYVSISCDGKRYMAHRLAWLYVHGQFPEEQIDHINGVRDDNRLCNLRCVSSAENQMNMKLDKRSSSGITGVHWHKLTGKWHARGPKKLHLGLFNCKATAGYVARRWRKLNGYHDNHGKNAEERGQK